MTTEQTLSADEDCVMQLKAPEKASQWTLSWGYFVKFSLLSKTFFLFHFISRLKGFLTW